MKNKRCIRHDIRKRWVIIIMHLCLFTALSCPVFAELPQLGHIIKGTVTDTKGIPLPGVTVLLKGTSQGISTDSEGRFSLRVPEPAGELTFSFIGYESQTVRFRTDTPLRIRLEEKIAALDEVTVRAYGVQRKRDVIGSVASITTGELKDQYPNTIESMFQGKLAGVNITNTSGRPGGELNFTIRGHNTLSTELGRVSSRPLFVVDGIPLPEESEINSMQSPLAGISPNDIERVDILKDASSCSMYGSRGANGVVIITTKKGRASEKALITATVSHSTSFRPYIPARYIGKGEMRFRLEALRNHKEAIYDYGTDSEHYMKDELESFLQGLEYNYFWWAGFGRSLITYQDSLNSYFNNSTDIMRHYYQLGRTLNAHININGGSEKVTYGIGLGYYNESGVIKNTGFKRITLNSNLGFQPRKNLDGNLNLAFSYTDRARTAKGTDPFISSSIFHETTPDIFETFSSRNPGPGTEWYEEMNAAYEKTKETNRIFNLRGGLDVAYRYKGFTLKSSVYSDLSLTDQDMFLPAFMNEYGYSYSSGGYKLTIMLLNENILSYEKTFGIHTVSAIAGISFQNMEQKLKSGYGMGGLADSQTDVSWYGSGYDKVNDIQLKEYYSTRSSSALVGMFFRINYKLKDTYLFEFAVRRDGSSKFGKNSRWGTFPSFAAGWTFSEEPFFAGLKEIIPYGKVRLSYGWTGKDFYQDYLAQEIYIRGNRTFQGKPTITTPRDGFPNPDLSWEETRQFDAGLDMDFFNYRMKFSGDFYHRYTDGLLATTVLPGDTKGVAVSRWGNGCDIVNYGIEATISGDVIRTETMRWNVSFNISRNWNRLEKTFDGRNYASPYSNNNISIVGKELNRIYVYRDEGIYTDQSQVPVYYINGERRYLGTMNQYYKPGDRRIIDMNGDGTIDSKDLIDGGSPLPKASGGISASFEWKGFDLNVTMPYSIGQHILYAGASLGTTEKALPIFADVSKIQFYQPGMTDAEQPANEMVNDKQNFAPNLLSNIYKVNYLKIKNISLGYTLPEKYKKIVGVGLRLFCSWDNIKTFKNYPGPNPETIDLNTGEDTFNMYPQARRFTIGITANF